jgi:hypothetical protein
MYRCFFKLLTVAVVTLALPNTSAQAFGTGGTLIIAVPLCDITAHVISSTSGGQTIYTGNIEAVNPIDNAITVPIGTFSATSQPRAESHMRLAARLMCAKDDPMFQVECGAVRYEATGDLQFRARIDCN